MGVQQHQHDWTQINGGVKCQNCSAFLSDATIGANSSPAHRSHQSNLNEAWKKSGGS